MGKPAARIGDLTAHGGTVTVGKPTVLIGKMPAATLGDMHVCPMVTGVVPHVGGPVTLGSMGVLVSKMPAARVSDITVCVGPPSMPAMGCFTVLIGEAGGGGGGGGAAAAATAAAAAKNGPKAIKPFDPGQPPEPRTENHYVEIQVEDSAGLPLGGVRYKLKDPDGNDIVGTASPEGRIRHDGYAQAGSFKVEFPALTNAKWSKAKARPDEQLTLKCDAEGLPDGVEAVFVVLEESAGGTRQRALAFLKAKVSGGKAEAKWALTKPDFPPSTGEKPEAGGAAGGDEPAGKFEHFFFVAAEGLIAVSDRAVFADDAEIKLVDEDGKAIPDTAYEMHLHDGAVRKGKLDKDGKAKEKDVPVGPYVIVLPEIVITAKPPKGGAGGGGGGSGGTPAAPAAPPWLAVARGEIGTAEIPGKQDNPRIVEYHKATKLKSGGDAVAWCSSFVNWVMEQAGFPKTGSAMALSWRKYGRKLDKPAYGCIGVIDWSFKGEKFKDKGHVGFVVGRKGKSLVLLGGNQGDQVKLSAFEEKLFKAFVLPESYSGESYELPVLEGPVSGANFAGTR